MLIYIEQALKELGVKDEIAAAVRKKIDRSSR
jgi:hypothetical protein